VPVFIITSTTLVAHALTNGSTALPPPKFGNKCTLLTPSTPIKFGSLTLAILSQWNTPSNSSSIWRGHRNPGRKSDSQNSACFGPSESLVQSTQNELQPLLRVIPSTTNVANPNC